VPRLIPSLSTLRSCFDSVNHPLRSAKGAKLLSAGCSDPEELQSGSAHPIKGSDPRALTGKRSLGSTPQEIPSFWVLKTLTQSAITLLFCDNKEGARWLWELWSKEMSWKKEPSNWQPWVFSTGWQLDVRKWPSICDSQLKVQTSLTFWLLEFNLTIYVDSIKDLFKNIHSLKLSILRPS